MSLTDQENLPTGMPPDADSRAAHADEIAEFADDLRQLVAGSVTTGEYYRSTPEVAASSSSDCVAGLAPVAADPVQKPVLAQKRKQIT